MTNGAETVGSGAIAGSWTHAHEEDSGGCMVFRPSGSDFPPSRGRTSLDLAAGGELRRGGPGPDDRRTTGTGEWSLDGTELTLRGQGGETERYRVESVEEKRLVLRRLY